MDILSYSRVVLIGLLMGAALSWAAPMAQAQQVPQEIAYQGTLADAEGNPVTGMVDLTFRIYDGPDDGAVQLPQDAPWENTFTGIPVSSGRFGVLLGGEGQPALPDAVLDEGGSLWLEVTVAVDGGAEEALPRTRLTSTAFARRAEQAQRVANGAAVRSLNGLTDAVALGAGENVTIDQDGSTLTISSTDPGIANVTSDGTLTGEGTSSDPLGLADGARPSCITPIPPSPSARPQRVKGASNER